MTEHTHKAIPDKHWNKFVEETIKAAKEHQPGGYEWQEEKRRSFSEGALFGYNFAIAGRSKTDEEKDKEIEKLKKAALGQSAKWYSDLLEEKDKRIRELEEALRECEEYFENRADADHNGENFVPNAEMKVLFDIQKLLNS